MANNDRKTNNKFYSTALRCNRLRAYFSIVINLIRRFFTKKF